MTVASFVTGGNAFDAVLSRIKLTLFFSMIFIFWGISPVLMFGYAAYILWNGFSFGGVAVGLAYAAWFAYSYTWPWSGGMVDNALSRHMRQRWSPSLWAGEYFSHSIVKTAELPTDRNYLIGCHPHGAISIGYVLCNACPRLEFREQFPGISQVATTMSGNSYWPFRREFAMLCGFLDCSRKSMNNLLSHPDKGKAVCVTIGGLSEFTATTNGKYFLKMKGRKGFVKVALENGASLVPLFNFGENELFNDIVVPDKKRLRNIQGRLRAFAPIVPPAAYGISMIGLPWGMLPKPGPVTSVVGAPIHVDKVEKPTQEQIDAVYDRYCANLIELFETHKGNYGIPKDEHIIFY